MENGDNRQPTSSNSQENSLTRNQRFLQYLDAQNRKNDVVIAEVEEFLKAYKAGEEIITSEAQNMIATITETKQGLFGRQKTVTYKKDFRDAIGGAIAAYQASTEINYKLKWEQAFELLDLIQRARVFGAIRNAKQQQQHFEEENLRLKEQVANLKKLNDKLLEENKLLHGLVDQKIKDNKGKDNKMVGDVGY
jgi:hypothetical protein